MPWSPYSSYSGKIRTRNPPLSVQVAVLEYRQAALLAGIMVFPLYSQPLAFEPDSLVRELVSITLPNRFWVRCCLSKCLVVHLRPCYLAALTSTSSPKEVATAYGTMKNIGHDGKESFAWLFPAVLLSSEPPNSLPLSGLLGNLPTGVSDSLFDVSDYLTA